MRRRRGVTAAFCIALTTALVAGALQGRGESPVRAGENAERLFSEGNYRDAYDLYREVLVDPSFDSLLLGKYLDDAVTCLQRLNREQETDGLRDAVVEAHPGDWRLLWRAAESWFGANHYGYIVAGTFRRGHHRGGGRYVNSFERDRTQALRLMERAMGLTGGEPASSAVAEFHLRFAAMLMGYRGYGGAWRLQYLSDMGELPDYEEGHLYRFGEATRGAPVGADGTPVYHGLPAEYGASRSDGERWRWMLRRAAVVDSGMELRVRMDFARFLHQQFGVQSLAEYGDILRKREPAESGDAGAWDLHTLKDEETMARLATGVKRFPLPDEYNFIQIFRGIAGEGGALGEQALNTLAQVFENRRQYGKAAKVWSRNIGEHGRQEWKEKRLRQILGSWGHFEPSSPSPQGEGAAVEYRYRNGRKVSFEAHRIRVRALLDDVKGYLRSNPRELDHDRMNIEQIGYRLVRKGESRYIERLVASWELELDPLPDHFDRLVTVSTPLQENGAYLVTARMEDGNTSKIILWVSDTVIVRKPLEGGNLFFVADAVTGEPLSRAAVDFFGYRQERTDWERVLGRRYEVKTKAFSYRTDEDGILVPNPGDFLSEYSWLITAGTEEGRFAYLGWRGVWHGKRYDREYHETKVYTVTDRPVYRPDQNVKFKVWVGEAKYDRQGPSPFAGQHFTVQVTDPRNEKVFEMALTADEWGGIDGEFSLAGEAALGVYALNVAGYGGGTFRVEEYKKPEFEVTVEAPLEPVALGETFTAVVRAGYYFGAPVKEAAVKYKVLRTPREQRWYPPGAWDWFYGPGYWWFAPEYSWYPRWDEWGIAGPMPWWRPERPAPPEVVAEEEVPIGEDGTVEVRIETAFAREVHVDTDHRYEIIAEVTDRSRRTITGRGEVIAARKPFNVYAWVHRGHYRVGDVVEAEFAALTADGGPVKGKGRLELLQVSYDDGEAVETLLEQWELDTGEDGRSRIQIKAAEAGQYRLSYRVTDGRGRQLEGGYLFSVRGAGFDGSEFRFNELELIPDRREYGPGDRVRVSVNTDRPGSTVLLFDRPSNGVYRFPRVLRMKGKSSEWAIDVGRKDMPNFFVEALTVSGGRVYREVREIVVPPEKKVLNVEVLPSKETYRPGEKAKVSLRLTDHGGNPVAGTAVVAVYDRSVEYISGGSNVPEIKAFFWKWRRSHNRRGESSLERSFANLLPKGEDPMQPIGVFGRLVASGAAPQSALGASDGGRAMRAMAVVRPSAAPMDMEFSKAEVMTEGAAAEGGESPGAPDVEVAVRREFADTAFWAASIETGEDGTAEAEFDMPENLTSWKFRTWAMGDGTAVGEGAAEAVTMKDLLVRLQSPRFFVERDEIVLSANIHNYLERDLDVRAILDLGGGSLEAEEGREKTVPVAAGGEARVDWRVRAVREGEAVVRMTALSDEASDAVEMRFPVYVHGMLKTESFSGAIRTDEGGSSFEITVPAERRVEQTRLEIRYSPTLAGAMVDALPYLAEYPYGCTEQTLNRFLPTVVTKKVLGDMGLDLEEIREKRTNLNAQEIGDDVERAKRWKRWDRNPVFDGDVIDDMVRRGVRRLAGMQLSDGGWGWFSGWGERSTAHTTATVVRGLLVASESGADIPPGMLQRGVEWLVRHEKGELEKLRNADGRRDPWKEHAGNMDAFVHMVLAGTGRGEGAMADFLFRDRTRLSVYALAMFGMALHREERVDELGAVMRNLEQFLVEDRENQTAWLELPGGMWWYWYGSEYEAHAYYLKLLAATEPGSPRSAGLVKYLLNNRRHATYWNSTRDTALCVEAIADYLRASGEDRPDMDVDIFIDGVRKKSVRIDAGNLFSYDNSLVIEGGSLTSGLHTVEIRRRGKGPVYYNAYLGNFTLEDHIEAAGLEVRVGRRYYLLSRDDGVVKVAGERGQALDQKVERWSRKALGNMDGLKSGDLVEVELEIESKNDYEYLVFEDMKPAGFEPVSVRSGYGGNDMGAYMELRDEKVVFFVPSLARGNHSLSYRMRAEVPGRFSALPTRAHAMYAPELKGNSEEIRLIVED